MADVDLKTRSSARAGEPVRFYGVHQPHAEHIGVKVDGHLHVVSVEREMMHAVEADPVLGADAGSILEFRVGHERLPVTRCRDRIGRPRDVFLGPQ